MKGLGNDIIETQRMLKAIENHGKKFLERLFTHNEISYCEKHVDAHIRFSGRFAAKEAIAKALGVGFGKDLTWKDFEILNDDKGKPFVKFCNKTRDKFENPLIMLSISHCKKFASAIAIWVS